jgi:hypothetical protein
MSIIIKEDIDTDNNVSNSIINVAQKYTDLEEIESNSKWIDLRTNDISDRAEKFQEIIRNQGLGNGEAYCMAAARYFYEEGHKNAGLNSTEEYRKIHKLLNNSPVSSFNNLNKEGLTTNNPSPGAIFFMKRRDDPSRGHAGLVVFNDGDELETIEGNTTLPKDKRKHHGDGVIKKKRKFDLTNTSSNLYLIGFVNPIRNSTEINSNSLNKKNSEIIDSKKLVTMLTNNSTLSDDILQYIPKWLKDRTSSNESFSGSFDLPDYLSIKEDRFLL